MVLFLFVIMLLRLQKEELRNTSRHAFQKFFGIVLSLVFAFQVIMIFRGGFLKAPRGIFHLMQSKVLEGILRQWQRYYLPTISSRSN